MANYSEFKVNIKNLWKYSLFLEKFHIFESINTLINSKLCKYMEFGGLKIGNFPKTVKRILLTYFTKYNKKADMKTILIYDGSFAGFLTAVYEVFDENLKEVCVVKPKHYAPEMFAEGKIIKTSNLKAKKVWHSLQLKVSKHAANELYKVFLSEIKGSEDAILRYIIHAYSAETFNHTDYSNLYVLRVHQVAKMVDREIQRLKDTIVMDQTKPDVSVAVVHSNFDVLPLLGKYFSRTYKSKKWVIYDKKRNYGLYYDLERLTQIELDQLHHVQELHSLELSSSDTPLHMKSQSALYNNRISADC